MTTVLSRSKSAPVNNSLTFPPCKGDRNNLSVTARSKLYVVRVQLLKNGQCSAKTVVSEGRQVAGTTANAFTSLILSVSLPVAVSVIMVGVENVSNSFT